MKTALLLAALAGLSSLTTAAPTNGSYIPGRSFGTEQNLKNVCAIAIGRDDTLLVAADGRVRFFDPASGTCLRIIATGLERADALATDGDTIYVFATTTQSRTLTIGNRRIVQPVPTGVVVKRFTWAGQPQPDLTLNAVSASAAKVSGGKLYVGDAISRTIRVYRVSDGQSVGTVGKDLRVCCGILDVNVEGSDVLVGNLGAFKVQRYDAAGALREEFGSRGSSDTAFYGCCNPVSVAAVPGGNLITVEKDPSRVKLYSRDGKLLQVFPKLEELVQGCQRVSIAVDSKGRVYLGVNASRHFVLQYVPQST